MPHFSKCSNSRYVRWFPKVVPGMGRAPHTKKQVVPEVVPGWFPVVPRARADTATGAPCPPA